MKTMFFVCLGIVICLNFVSIAETLGGTECLAPRVSLLESSAFRLASGISNIMFAPCELYDHMISSATRGAYNGACSCGLTGYLSGAMTGYMGGSVTGLAAMIRKFGTGLVQAGTFWKPEYIQGRVEPKANTCVPFQVDCFSDPDPFWFYGPPSMGGPRGF
jgi:hypothetical protein